MPFRYQAACFSSRCYHELLFCRHQIFLTASQILTISLSLTRHLVVGHFRESDRARREEYNRELQEMQERVNQRPLLFEQQSQFTARRAAERKYADILRSAGVDEALVQNLVTKEGGIVDAESDDELEETGSQINYGGSRRSSGAEYRSGIQAGNEDDSGSDVEEEIDEEDAEI